jgi:mannosyltransferase OCH1-like enzyme
MTYHSIPHFPQVIIDDSIPRRIYQTWETRYLPADMASAVQSVKNANPGFEHELFDNNDCREFIKEHFPKEIVFAFDSLIPGAYKADLWRYCILYIQGGIYLDIKFVPVNGFRFESLIANEHLCKNWPNAIQKYDRGVYNAIMIMKAGNPMLKEAIYRIYENCCKKDYCYNWLYITGPGLLSEIIPSNYVFTMNHQLDDKVLLKDTLILQAYPTYRSWTREYYARSTKEHYGAAWMNKRVYSGKFTINSLPTVISMDIVPRRIYQTWETKNIPADMAAAVQTVKDANPGFEHTLFDDKGCREFIKEHFPQEIVAAFDSLIPGAYKADLWRYCILYIQGGIYLDIKFVPVNGFSFNSIINHEHLCKDRPEHFANRNGVYNAIMIMKPGNPILKEAIYKIYQNYCKKDYCRDWLYISGPGLLSEIVPLNFPYTMYHRIPDSVHLHDTLILDTYPTYRTWTKNYYANSTKEHYGIAWWKKRVYAS